MSFIRKSFLFACLGMIGTASLAAQDSNPVPQGPPAPPTKLERLATVEGWTHNCREYVEKAANCKVAIDVNSLAPLPNSPGFVPFQYDISIGNTEDAAIVLLHASPFAKCALTTSPSPSARDLNTSITSAFTSLAGIGALGTNPLLLAQQATTAVQLLSSNKIVDLDVVPQGAIEQNNRRGNPTTPPELVADLKAFSQRLDALRPVLQPIVRDFQRISAINAAYAYAYPDEATFQTKARTLYAAVRGVIDDPLPAVADANATTQKFRKLRDDVTAWQSNHAAEVDQFPILASHYSRLSKAIDTLAFAGNHLRDAVQYLGDEQKALEPLFDLLVQLSDPQTLGEFDQGPYLGQVFNISNAPQKKSTQTLTCKDAVTGTQAFDTITFVVYFGRNPQLDVSAGFLVSLLKGHQVGTVSGPLDTTTTPPTASNVLTVTGSSRVQFMPAAFLEYHPWNFKLPWVKDQPVPTSGPPHPSGYVGSFGFAEGIALNPNNGTTSAEFFTGLSLGIQRVAFVFGNHFGRYQEYGNGYSIGDTIPSGVTPPTYRRWTNHPAFGFVYRVPIR